jgi:hypothetical protein
VAQALKDVRDPTRTYTSVLRFIENSVLGFLQVLFSTAPAGRDPRNFHYDDNDDLSEILIQGQSTDNLKTVDTRPKIVVARGPVSWGKTHINNFVGARNTTLESRRYAGIHSGSVGISCFSRTDLEADLVAEICFNAITGFRDVIRTYGFLTIDAAEIGQRGLIKMDARPDLFVTPVLIKVQVTRDWHMSNLDPIKLREILVTLTTNPSLSGGG